MTGIDVMPTILVLYTYQVLIKYLIVKLHCHVLHNFIQIFSLQFNFDVALAVPVSQKYLESWDYSFINFCEASSYQGMWCT